MALKVGDRLSHYDVTAPWAHQARRRLWERVNDTLGSLKGGSSGGLFGTARA